MTKFLVRRACESTGSGGVAAAGDISLFETAYATTLPTNGAMTFSLADIDPTKLGAYVTVYQQARLNAVKVAWYPAATTLAMRRLVISNQSVPGTDNVTHWIPQQAVFVYDPDTANLETLDDLLSHQTAKVYMNNTCKEIVRMIKPRLIETVQAESDGGTEVQCPAASKKPPWISIGLGSNINATRVRHYGLKWDVRPEIPEADVTQGAGASFTAGTWFFTYYVGWRFST